MPKALQLVVFTCVAIFQGEASAQTSFERLLKSVEEGEVKVVAKLLDGGLDPNTTDSNGYTVLMIASRLGREQVAELLLARKANVDRRSPAGDTALMMASLGGHLSIARKLLAAGAVVSQDGWTALHYAAFGGHGEMVKELLARGADKDAPAPNGYTPLMLAVRNGHVAAARALLYEDVDLAHKGPNGETALGIAMKRETPELAELLRRAGAVE